MRPALSVATKNFNKRLNRPTKEVLAQSLPLIPESMQDEPVGSTTPAVAQIYPRKGGNGTARLSVQPVPRDNHALQISVK